MLYDLFISYSTKDGLGLAKAIASKLKEKFIIESYYADATSKTKTNIDAEIKHAIGQSKRVLILFTPEAVKSSWVTGELKIANQKNKEIFICRENSVMAEDLPIIVQDLEHINFENIDDLFSKLLDKIEWGIPVIIPASGRAGGLYPLNIGMPKILLPIGKKPMLHRIIEKLDPEIFSKVFVITKRFAEMIEHYASLLDSEIQIQCIKTAAGTLPAALKELPLNTSFMIHYSDIILESNVKWKAFIKQHKKNIKDENIIGTLMASQYHQSPVGRIMPDSELPQLIKHFSEKPNSTRDYKYRINMAISIFEPEFIDTIDINAISLYGECLKKAMKRKQFCWFGHARWRHIQTIGDWYEAQKQYFPEDVTT